MLEIEQWVIENNPHFFMEQLAQQEKSSLSDLNVERDIENLKNAELELLSILKSNHSYPEQESD